MPQIFFRLEVHTKIKNKNIKYNGRVQEPRGSEYGILGMAPIGGDLHLTAEKKIREYLGLAPLKELYQK